MNISSKTCYPFFILLILALSIRLFLFYTYWRDLRHGSADNYGSAAIGLYYGEGLTVTKLEQKKINNVATNYSGNYLSFHEVENRKTFTEFLPGPAILLASLWKIFPIYNFSIYLWMQIALESLLISIFYFTFRKTNKTIVLATTILMTINPVAVKYTLTMGYDFWPQFCVLVNFIGITFALKSKKIGSILFITGLMTGITIWFRSITSFLPFYISCMLLLYLRLNLKLNLKKIGINIALYLVAVIIAAASLSFYRYELTGNYRPTRSTFWHSFWAGVGQFSNPYDLLSEDLAIWEFGLKLNSELKNSNLWEMYNFPDSLYEQTLKAEAYRFLKEHPHLFVRNIFYRIAIMISPIMYRSGRFIPENLTLYFFYSGFFLLIIWFLGMRELYQCSKRIFWLSATIYSYFFSTLCSFYVVGRAILPILFINIFVYLFGVQYCLRRIKRFTESENYSFT